MALCCVAFQNFAFVVNSPPKMECITIDLHEHPLG